jgi:hypothetical protein
MYWNTALNYAETASNYILSLSLLTIKPIFLFMFAIYLTLLEPELCQIYSLAN